MKADDLWEKYAAHRGNGYPTIDKPDFLAALTEYGELVKAEAVKVCNAEATCEGVAQRCAAAIEKMELP